jgi:hypothetical protein
MNYDAGDLGMDHYDYTTGYGSFGEEDLTDWDPGVDQPTPPVVGRPLPLQTSAKMSPAHLTNLQPKLNLSWPPGSGEAQPTPPVVGRPLPLQTSAKMSPAHLTNLQPKLNLSWPPGSGEPLAPPPDIAPDEDGDLLPPTDKSHKVPTWLLAVTIGAGAAVAYYLWNRRHQSA